MGKGVHSQLTMADIGFTANKTTIAGQWVNIGSYSVGVTEQLQLGYDKFQGMENALGRAYAIFMTAEDVVFAGELKAVIEDAQGNTLAPLILQSTLDNLNQGLTDMTKRMPLPECGYTANRERKITFYVKATSSAIINAAKSKMLISATRYSL